MSEELLTIVGEAFSYIKDYHKDIQKKIVALNEFKEGDVDTQVNFLLKIPIAFIISEFITIHRNVAKEEENNLSFFQKNLSNLLKGMHDFSMEQYVRALEKDKNVNL